MPIIDGAGRFHAPAGEAHFDEHLRSADLSVGTYSIPAGAVDDQTPHTEDEIYVVTSGPATPCTWRPASSTGSWTWWRT